MALLPGSLSSSFWHPGETNKILAQPLFSYLRETDQYRVAMCVRNLALAKARMAHDVALIERCLLGGGSVSEAVVTISPLVFGIVVTDSA